MKKLTMEEMHRLSSDAFLEAQKMGVTIVLDDVRSMMNTGSIFRTSDAFRVEKIFLCGITATPPNREIQKTALGATDTVAWEYHENCSELVQLLKRKGMVIVAIEQLHESIMLDHWKIDPAREIALVFGNEVHGVSEEVLALCDYGVEIPQAGTKHSLNIAVSAGIVIWEAFRQLHHRIPG
jgi:tRNA G18 (ribose-2'-O)-methylase SpoU